MYLKWNLTKKCTLNCKFCHNVSDRKDWKRDTGVEQLSKIVNNIALHKDLKGISLLGGDPLEYKYINELAENLETHNIPFGFITAGEEVCTGKFDSILLNKSLNFIGLSIDSLNPNTVSYVRNKDMLLQQLQSLDHVLNFKKKYDLNYQVFTNTIFMNVNRTEIIELIDYMIEKKVNKVQILEYKHSSRASHNFSVTFGEEMELLQQLAEYIQRNPEKSFSNLELCFLTEPGKDYLRKISARNDVSLGTSSQCPIFRDTAFLSNDGFVYPCDNYKPYLKILPNTGEPEKIYKIENIIEQPLQNISQNHFFEDVKILSEKSKEELFSNLEPCNQCDYLLNKCFPCLQYSMSENKVTSIYENKCKTYMEKINQGVVTS